MQESEMCQPLVVVVSMMIETSLKILKKFEKVKKKIIKETIFIKRKR
jgi:hypothetical protein